HEVLDHLKDDIAEDDETDEKRDDGARVEPCEEEDADDGPDDGKSHQRPFLADEADSGARITGLKHVYHQRRDDEDDHRERRIDNAGEYGGNDERKPEPEHSHDRSGEDRNADK